jgi:hypothetical protein
MSFYEMRKSNPKKTYSEVQNKLRTRYPDFHLFPFPSVFLSIIGHELHWSANNLESSSEFLSQKITILIWRIGSIIRLWNFLIYLLNIYYLLNTVLVLAKQQNKLNKSLSSLNLQFRCSKTDSKQVHEQICQMSDSVEYYGGKTKMGWW